MVCRNLPILQNKLLKFIGFRNNLVGESPIHTPKSFHLWNNMTKFVRNSVHSEPSLLDSISDLCPYNIITCWLSGTDNSEVAVSESGQLDALISM